MGIAVPCQLWKAEHQQTMALIGYSGLGLAGYGWTGLGGLAAPLLHRDGPFLCGNGEHLINGLCKKKRSAEAEPEAWSRGTLTLRLMLTTAMVALTLDTAMAVLAMVVLATVMARGPLTLRLMPTTALAVMVDMDSDMAATAMVVLATVMARGPLTLRLMPTTALAVMVDMDLDMA